MISCNTIQMDVNNSISIFGTPNVTNSLNLKQYEINKNFNKNSLVFLRFFSNLSFFLDQIFCIIKKEPLE